MQNKLQIVLITYNRKEYLKNTLDSILAANSPIKDFDIKIINNASTDGTTELLNEYTSIYKNITHIINKINIGGNANICKAFSENLSKDYVWLLADNDEYNWDCWNEIEFAIENNYDQILTMKNDKTLSDMLRVASLISGAIYKTSIIDENVIENMFCNINYIFPHLVLATNIINNKGSVYYIENDLVKMRLNPERENTFLKGLKEEQIIDDRKYMFSEIGYFVSMKFIFDKTTRYEMIEHTRHTSKSLFDLFISMVITNKMLYKNYFYNYLLVFNVLNFSQKLRFLLAIIVVNLSKKDYSFYEIKTQEEWNIYLETINEQKYIDKLAKTLKNKKVVLYGAGMFYEILSQNYDLTKLNIVGISDRKFEEAYRDTYNGISVIKPSELKDRNFDVILFTMKLYKQMEVRLKNQGINKKMYSLIAHSNKYEIKN